MTAAMGKGEEERGGGGCAETGSTFGGREVVEVLAESLTLKETLIPTEVVRLMLVSDILHNSSAPVKNASAY
ncbi:hypothetical protein Droror1_Dr00019142 [Drosera rotundifolia]